MGLLRAFLYGPSRRTQRFEYEATARIVGTLGTVELVEAAYRRSAGRLNALFFAQGVVVGALGNLFASAAGHFIDRAGRWVWQDDVWLGMALLTLFVMTTMAVGALERLRQDHRLEGLFTAELKRRGGAVTDDASDPEELLARGPREPPPSARPKR